MSAMKTMLTWTLKSGQTFHEAVRRFVAGEGAPPEGVKMFGRWHSVDMSIGFTLYETDNSAALYAGTAKWADVLDVRTYIVIEDSQAGAVLAALMK